jgi:hypothetical protein
MEACGEKGGEERMVEKVRDRVCVGREKIARFSAPKILRTKAVSGGFEPVLVGSIQFVKLQERLQKISLTCHLSESPRIGRLGQHPHPCLDVQMYFRIVK